MTIDSKIIEVPGATGDIHSNHQAKFDAAVEQLNNNLFDFGFLHIKAIDDLAHDKNIFDRIKFLEKIDGIIGSCLQQLHDTVVVVTGDHTTNVHIGDHTCEPVPFVISSTEKVMNACARDKFDEINCARGSLGRFPGSQVMELVFRFKNYVKNP